MHAAATLVMTKCPLWALSVRQASAGRGGAADGIDEEVGGEDGDDAMEHGV